MNIHATWSKLYEEKLNWAYRAEKKFYQSFRDQEIRNLYMKGSHGEVNVSLYGKSQVGKTTLILKLIGIKEIYINEVSDILRGGRKKGNSSTVTAMVYSKSMDDSFYFSIDSGERTKLNSVEMEERLVELRRQVEMGGIENLQGIFISIPRKYFREETTKTLTINIIDLPGIDSSEEKEQYHVKNIIKKYVPISNLIILIDRVDNLKQLKDIEIPGIDDWKDTPERFKLVLTRSVSTRSALRTISQLKNINKQEYLKMYRDEILRNFQLNELPEHMLYPIEYGESWNELSKNNSSIKCEIEPIIESLYEDLISEIVRSQNPYNLLMMNAKVHHSCKKMIERNLKTYQQILEDINQRIERIQNRIQEHNEIIKENKEILTVLEEEKARVKKIDKLYLKSCNFTNSRLSYQYHRKREGLLRFIQVYKDYVKETAMGYMEKIDEEQRIKFNYSIFKSILEVCEKESAEAIREIGGKMLGKYLLPNTWRKHESLANDAAQNISREVTKYVNREYSKLKNKKIAEIEGRTKEAAFRIDETVIMVKNKEQQLEELSYQYHKRIGEMKTYIEITKEDMENGKSFRYYLKGEFMKEYSKYIRIINSNGITSEEKLIYVQYLLIISDEMTKLEELIW